MAESRLHLAMKASVTSELCNEGYLVIEEPQFPPAPRLSWSAYRPDLVGVRITRDGEEFVFVECETRPRARRINSKNFRSVGLQTVLTRNTKVRRILVIPRGKLRAIDRGLRSSWEIWVAGGSGFCRIPTVRDRS